MFGIGSEMYSRELDCNLIYERIPKLERKDMIWKHLIVVFELKDERMWLCC